MKRNKNIDGNATLGIVTLIVIIVLMIIGFFTVDIVTIRGTQAGIKETWADGVQDTVYRDKTYVLIPAFTQKMFVYDMKQQVYVMNNKDDGTEYAEGRKADAYVVQSKDQQDMTISLRVQWRRNPENLLNIHRYASKNLEETILRPTLTRIVKNEATTKTALEAYSGDGLVDLQKAILTELRADEELKKYIIIDGFTIEGIGLDRDYTKEIVARQVAVQAQMRNVEETKVAIEAAKKVEAEAQADYNRQVVAAERDKRMGILESEKKAQQQILAAEAQAKQVELAARAERDRNVLIAEGEKEASLNRAEAILAMGKAEAEATKLKMLAYSGTGADNYVTMEVAKQMAEAYKNIKGYLPENMNISILSEQFDKGISVLMNPPAVK